MGIQKFTHMIAHAYMYAQTQTYTHTQACIFFIVAIFFGYSHFLNICLQIHEKRWVAEDFYLQLFPHRPSVFQYSPDLISDIILVMVGSQYGLSFWL